MKKINAIVLGLPLALLAFASIPSGPSVGQDADKKAEAATEKPKVNKALERTRKQVRMLDAIYKGAIVHVTAQYVEDENDVPAGTVFKKIFAIAKENGFHEACLLDASGEAYNDENLPQDDFEKKAVKALRDGEDWYEKIERKDGKRFLRVATPIPVVMEKCVLCHQNYEGVKAGVPIGAMGYTIPIE